MQFSHALIALVAASLANAQLPNIPPCALSCLVDALGNDGCSQLTDFECHCKKPELPGKITPCVEKSCDVAAQSSVSNLVIKQCSSAGVPIKLPPIGGGGTTTSDPSVPTTKPTGKPTTTSPSYPTTNPSEGPTVSRIPSGTGSKPVPTSTPTTSRPAEFPGAGSNLNANIGGVAAALLAVAAYL
ncbi:proline rich antigen 2 [Paracoccidioides lutzii Pb01]|uniref:Proline rich antigen 2 n=2 Tax=Paracoccidioides TaxID=38946 RepID=C1H315_PARBA|nr:proline rich antigen 2 [Paracoccidioides lutzii Pb01]EEH34109.1 proline rich antigen 2 [Paracoccidioides lutzii Pb01]